MKHDINIDISRLDPTVIKLINKILSDATKNKIKVKLLDSPYISESGKKIAGWFCPEEKILSVACRRSLDIWVNVLAHESAHMDQWAENCIAWNTVETPYDKNLQLDAWLEHEIELNTEQLKKIVIAVQWMELDAEKRAIRKMRQSKVPIDILATIQRANSYIYFYTLMAAKRKWYKANQAPYEREEIFKLMPNKFLSLKEYATVPPHYIIAYEKYVFEILPNKIS